MGREAPPQFDLCTARRVADRVDDNLQVDAGDVPDHGRPRIRLVNDGHEVDDAARPVMDLFMLIVMPRNVSDAATREGDAVGVDVLDAV